MKVATKIIAIFLLVGSFSAVSYAQIYESAGSQITANIVSPVGVPKTVNSEFGNVSLVVTAYIKMTPVGHQSKSGSIVLPVPSGTFTATIYNFVGNTGCTYNVSYLPVPMLVRNGSDMLQVSSFTPVLNSGSDLIAGVFVAVTPANVTVNYN